MRERKRALSRIIFLFLIMGIFLISYVSAGDVAYIYNKNFKIDNNIKTLLNQINLSVDLIQENKIPSTNLSKYRLIFVGDERFKTPKNIPIGKYPTVVSNYYHGYDWGLTDNDGVSKLGRTEPMSVKLNNSIVVQVYNQGVFDSSTVAIPYYYLGKNDKAQEMNQIAGTYSGNGYDLGDVISYANKGTHLVNGKTTLGNTCFFGIVESDYWTQDAKSMFLECLTFVGSVCSKDLDCPADSESLDYCSGNGIYKNFTDYSCVNKGTIYSRCAATVTVNKVKECSVGCGNGKCINCFNDSQCGTNSFVDGLFCQNNNVFQNFITFTCASPGTTNSACSNSTSALKKLDCLSNQACENGQCLNVTCRNNNDCRDNNNNTEDICLNPGTSQSSCQHNVILCNKNSDCGVDGLSGANYCSNNKVYQNSSVFTCNNPGTSNSTCSSANTPQLNQTCTDSQTCFNGKCLNVLCKSDEDCGQNRVLNQLFCQNDNLFDKYITFKCNNPGTGVSACSNTTENRIVEDCSDKCYNNQCVNIVCYNNAQCNDNNANTEDKCLNPGTQQSTCDHKVIHCSRSSDCGMNGFNGNKICMNGNSFEEFVTWTCNFAGTSQSTCVASKMPILSKYCEFQCVGGECLSCFNDLSCGNSAFIGNKYCIDNAVYQDFQQFSCSNPGTSSSTCSSSLAPKLVQTCAGVCFKGQCKGVTCNSDAGCDDGNVMTKDLCTNAGTQSSYCSHTQINCNANTDCGINGYFGSEFCVGNSIFQNFQNSKCMNPGTSNSYCAVSVASNLLNGCGESYCENWQSNYCKNGNVYHQRTCNNKACANGQCITTNSVDEEFVQICSYGCSNGACVDVKCNSNAQCNDNNDHTEDKCLNPGTGSSSCQHNFITCNSNSQCGENGLIGDLFCSNNGLYQNFRKYTCHNPGTTSSYCSSTLDPSLRQSCGSGQSCNGGQCVNVACTSDIVCSDNNPMTLDSCVNPGTTSSYCSHSAIACNSNSQCGTNGFIDGLFCQSGNVYQNYITYTCGSPGTTSSFCSSNIAPQLKQTCSSGQMCSSGTCVNVACSNDAQCNDNNANTEDKCLNPGTQHSACQHNPISCNGNSDCGTNGFIDGLFCQSGNVYQNYKTYTCNNPGTTSASCSNALTPTLKQSCPSGQTCSNGQCSTISCSSNSDCNDNNALTIDTCNNPGTSQSSCSHTPIICNNANDCGTNGFTGNPFCQSGSNNVFQDFLTYTCSNPGTVQSSCSLVSAPQLKQTCSQNQICSNGNCVANACVDNDHDGYDTCSPGTPGDDGKQVDCNDNNANVYPNAPEICNGIDDDCDGLIDENNGNCANNQICSSGTCVNIVCSNDAQCNDNNVHTFDKCNNPGTVQSSCSHTPIICLNNGECGTDGFVDGTFCQNNNVFQNFLTYTCNNPGTVQSNCSVVSAPQLKQTCKLSEICFNGNCFNNPCVDNDHDGYDTCSPGTPGDDGKQVDCNDNNANVHPNAPEICNGIDDDCDGLIDENNGNCANNQICSSGQCINFVCMNDDDCNDNNDHTFDKCNNPGTVQSSCSHTPIICLNNGECGTDGLTGQLFCKDNNVFDKFLTYTCNNPGTVLSFCSNSSSDQLKQTCANGCANGQCIIKCQKDSDCDDSDDLTIDKCLNPGTSQSSCINTPIECNKASDCGTDGFLNQEFCMNGSLFDKFLTYTCNNPGTLLSFCTNNTEDRFINDTSSNTKTVTFSSRNARLGNTGYCKKSPVLIYNDLDGIDTIQITDVKGYVCARSANGVCSDNALVGCMAGFKHSCASGTQGTIGIYDVNNKLLKEYTIAQVKNGVDVPAGGKKAYVYFKDSFYDDNNGAFKCSFKFTKTKESSCNIECSSDADCGTILKKVTLGSDHFGKSGAFRTLAINEGLTADIYHHFGNTRATGERVCALTEKYQTALGLDRPYTTFISKQPYTFVTCGNDWNYLWNGNKWIVQNGCVSGTDSNFITCGANIQKKCINPGTTSSKCVAS